LCDVALKALSREFDRMYSDVGRPSIAPEKLLRKVRLVSVPVTVIILGLAIWILWFA
jgi:hypothetical protein